MQENSQNQFYEMVYDLAKIHSYIKILLNVMEYNEQDNEQISLIFFTEFIESQIHSLFNRMDTFNFYEWK